MLPTSRSKHRPPVRTRVFMWASMLRMVWSDRPAEGIRGCLRRRIGVENRHRFGAVEIDVVTGGAFGFLANGEFFPGKGMAVFGKEVEGLFADLGVFRQTEEAAALPPQRPASSWRSR